MERQELSSVYPRWRGEHERSHGYTLLPLGLSSLARGTLRDAEKAGRLPRFIPAGAGNTRPHSAGDREYSVYPRWRGEHLPAACADDEYFGLSPLARGTLIRGCQDNHWDRFIPASAGNTSPRWAASWRLTVYPRWRGEHPLSRFLYRNKHGLSPLARGTPPDQPALRLNVRFIPAGAGNTIAPRRLTEVAPVYPRWRGEHKPAWRDFAEQGGLSPLARGTRPESHPEELRARFIPAGAGNTLKLYICSKSPLLLSNKLPTVR